MPVVRQQAVSWLMESQKIKMQGSHHMQRKKAVKSRTTKISSQQ